MGYTNYVNDRLARQFPSYDMDEMRTRKTMDELRTRKTNRKMELGLSYMIITTHGLEDIFSIQNCNISKLFIKFTQLFLKREEPIKGRQCSLPC